MREKKRERFHCPVSISIYEVNITTEDQMNDKYYLRKYGSNIPNVPDLI